MSMFNRVNGIREALWDVRPQTEQEWLDDLTWRGEPERELEIWETVVCAYTAFFEARTPSAKTKDQSLRVLLDCVAGHNEYEIQKAAYKALSIAEIKCLIAHYSAAAQTINKISQLKSPGRQPE